MKIFSKFRHLLALFGVCILALLLVAHGAPLIAGVAIVGLFQLSQLALSNPVAGLFYVTTLSDDQVEEFKEIIGDIKMSWDEIKNLPKLYDELRAEVKKLRRAGIGGGGNSGVRWMGNIPYVTDDCARALTSVFILDCSKLKNGLDTLIPDEQRRKHILGLANNYLGMEASTRGGGALGTADIPLPTVYMPQIVELVFAFGAARQYATVFPLGAGLVKLPRLKAGEDDFGYIGAGTAGQSQNIPQKEVQAELVTFTANKAGGIIRIPYEIEEDTFVPIGQFLARYIGRQFAKLEDKTLFIADGTAAYANITGIATYCATAVNGATPYLAQLGAGKTKPSQATVDDFRNMRALVNAAILGNMAANGQTMAAYYMHPSFEPLLRSFNKYPNFVVFEYVNGKPMFDGFPIRWIGVSQPYSANGVAPSAPLAFFGDLSFWYLAERGAPRVEVSKEVYFATDEIAMRALERIDVEAMAIDVVATLMTAAA